jgi:hypothetical protein
MRRLHMHAYELRIGGLDRAISLADARWKLFACPEVRDLVRAGGKERFLVLYDGKWAQPTIWCHVLSNAGYPAEPVVGIDGTEAA